MHIGNPPQCPSGRQSPDQRLLDMPPVDYSLVIIYVMLGIGWLVRRSVKSSYDFFGVRCLPGWPAWPSSRPTSARSRLPQPEAELLGKGPPWQAKPRRGSSGPVPLGVDALALAGLMYVPFLAGG